MEQKKILKNLKHKIIHSSNLKKEIDQLFIEAERDLNDQNKAVIIAVLDSLCDSSIPDVDFRGKISRFSELLKELGILENETDYLVKL